MLVLKVYTFFENWHLFYFIVFPYSCVTFSIHNFKVCNCFLKLLRNNLYLLLSKVFKLKSDNRKLRDEIVDFYLSLLYSLAFKLKWF